MTPERHRHIGELYHAALAVASDERTAFLAAASGGDAELQREVESLLTAHAQAGSFIVAPATEAFMRGGLDGRAPFVGRQIGPYTIQGALGAGGMGEVYRAGDSKLGRDVAIKILPPIFSADSDRRARFDREARLLASLNHPHIGAIYGLEDMEGAPALILELVDGDTLAERMAKGPMPVSEALNIAEQIADALDAAHEKGITHRDLKPANIKITPAGVVKVLDFGLAKAASDDAISGTRDGVILGTSAYMSPEQARGKPVDKRTDIWAFGCVLYEMLTSRPAYAGDTISDTIARIIEREPDWRALPAATPPAITRLLRRCLDKDPKRRLHDIADARIEIEDVVSGASLSSAEAAAVLPRQRPVRLPWAVAVLASLVALAALTLYMWTPPQTPAWPKEIASSGPAQVLPGFNRSLAITPDSKHVVYTSYNGTLVDQPLDSLVPRPITTTVAPVNYVFVSPDSRSVGFVEGGTIKKVALTGGPVTTILDTGTGGSNGATWAPGDTIIFAAARASGLQQVSDDGGEVKELTRPDPARNEAYHLWPEMLPGGRAVLFTIMFRAGGPDAAQVAMFDLVTKKTTILISGGSHAHYLESGHLVYTARGTLVAAAFDPARPEQPPGQAVTMLPRLTKKKVGAGEFDVSANGTLAYLDAPDSEPANTLVEVDRGGQETPLKNLPAGHYGLPRLSPEGSQVAFVQDPGVKVWDLDQHKLSVTFDGVGGNSLLWNGSYLLFHGFSQQAADGTGKREPLGTHREGFPSGVTLDGKVLFTLRGDVMVRALDGHDETLINGPATERNGVVSPNERWLAYETNTSGEFWINVTSYPIVSDPKRPIARGTKPLWAPTKNGQELFWVAPDGAIKGVHYDPRGAKWSEGTPETVLKAVYARGEPLSARNYDVFPDGRRFLMVKQATEEKIVVVPDWVEKLKQQIPTR